MSVIAAFFVGLLLVIFIILIALVRYIILNDTTEEINQDEAE